MEVNSGVKSSKVPIEVSAFLKKTYAILMDSANSSIISWSDCGTRFSVLDHHLFQSEILPFHFKHNKHKSFVRQLNIHGFKKFSVKAEKGHDYYNENFVRGQPHLLSSILRISIKSKEEKETTDQDTSSFTRRSINITDSLPQKNKVLVCGSSLSSQSSYQPVSNRYSSTGINKDHQALQEALNTFISVSSLSSLSSQNLSESFTSTERSIYEKTKELLAMVDKFTKEQIEKDAIPICILSQDQEIETLGKRKRTADCLDSPEQEYMDNMSWKSLLMKPTLSDEASISCDLDFGLCD